MAPLIDGLHFRRDQISGAIADAAIEVAAVVQAPVEFGADAEQLGVELVGEVYSQRQPGIWRGLAVYVDQEGLEGHCGLLERAMCPLRL